MTEVPTGMGIAVWRTALVLALLLITWLALTPSPERPGLAFDKLNHVAAFAVLAALVVRGFPQPRAARWGLILLLVYGAGLEWIQGLTPARQASIGDWFADSIGVGILLLADALWCRWRGRE